MSNPTATIRITELYVDNSNNSATNIPSIDEVYPTTPVEETIDNFATTTIILTIEGTSESTQITNLGSQSIADSSTEIQNHSAIGAPSVTEALSEFVLNNAGVATTGGGEAYGDGNYGDGNYGEGSGSGDNQTIDEVIM